MMHHFHLNNDQTIKYKLFCHFPIDKEQPEITITKSDIETTLKTKNLTLQKYTTVLNGFVNIDKFLTQFSIEIGDSLDNMTEEIYSLLLINGIPSDDIDILAYPNAIQYIADLSIKHNSDQRTTTKKETIRLLRAKKEQQYQDGLSH